MVYAVAFSCACIGAALAAICGFGVGMFSMMFLPYFMSTTTSAAAVVGLVSVIQGAWICYMFRSKIRWKKVIFPAVGNFIAAVLFVPVSKTAAGPVTRLALGIILVLLSVFFISGAKDLRIKATPLNGLMAGCLSGFLGTMFAISGPPASVYYTSLLDDKEEYLATIQAYFLISGVHMAIQRIINGIVTEEVLKSAAAGVVGIILGTILGKKLFERIEAVGVRKAAYCLMAASGILMILQTIC